jgi:chromate transporter
MFGILLKLFLSFLKVGSFSFGGAYSLIPLIEKEVVANHNWLTHDEFLKVLGMVEVFPGAISIKFATYTGFKIGGVFGAIAANIGNMIMPMFIIMLATYGCLHLEKYVQFQKALTGIKFAIVGMIVAIMYQYAIKNFVEWKSMIFLFLGATLIIAFKLHPAYVVIIAGILALFI